MHKKIKILFTITLLVCIIILIYIIKNNNLIDKINSNANNVIDNKLDLKVNLDTQKITYDYRLEKYTNRDDRYLLDAYNEKIAIESLNTACGAVIMEFINNNVDQIFILQNINYGSERPPQSLYKINLKDLTCKKLNISSEIGDFGNYKISPDNTKIALSTESNPTQIKILNLINDTSTIVVVAKQGETFNAGWGALSNKFVIDWIDNETIKYDTFKDVPQTQATSENLKPIISTQVIKVK